MLTKSASIKARSSGSRAASTLCYLATACAISTSTLACGDGGENNSADATSVTHGASGVPSGMPPAGTTSSNLPTVNGSAPEGSTTSATSAGGSPSVPGAMIPAPTTRPEPASPPLPGQSVNTEDGSPTPAPESSATAPPSATPTAEGAPGVTPAPEAAQPAPTDTAPTDTAPTVAPEPTLPPVDMGSGGMNGEPTDVEPGTCTSSSLSPGNSNRTVDVDGTTRSFILHVPPGYSGTEAVPLVFDYHGIGGNGGQQQNSSGFQAVSDREGFLVAFPDGIDNAWNVGPCCTNSRDVDEVAFAKAMIESIAADGCVDRNRVYSAGFSMGGGMSHFNGCNAADVFAAVAPTAFDLLVDQPCEPTRPIPMLLWRGEADPVVPFEGGPGSGGRVTFLGAQQSLDSWSEVNGCTEPTTTEGLCTILTQCAAGVEVGLCADPNGGHSPGDADVLWEFLSRFSLP